MKVIFDVIGAPSGSGGPEAHALEVLCAWVRRFPNDDLIVVGTPWPRLDVQTRSQVRWVKWPNRRLPLRVLGQLVFVPLLMLLYRDRVLLVSLPVLSPLSPRNRSYVFAHDWRHIIRREEFPLLRRMYRSIWLRSVLRARVTFCISRKTLDETASLAPDAALVLAENGHDHARRWNTNRTAADSPTLSTVARAGHVVVTFGHRNNKRPELVIAALATMESTSQLVVLGADGGYRASLETLAAESGVAGRVHFPGYVSEEEYQRLVSHADCVVLASTDEGFGMPVAEALSLGRPVVVTSDGGLEKIFAEAVQVADPNGPSIGEAITAALTKDGRGSAYRAPTWEDTVATVRARITRLTAEPEFPIRESD